MAWENENMSVKVNLYCSLLLNVDKWSILLDCFNEG